MNGLTIDEMRKSLADCSAYLDWLVDDEAEEQRLKRAMWVMQRLADIMHELARRVEDGELGRE